MRPLEPQPLRMDDATSPAIVLKLSDTFPWVTPLLLKQDYMCLDFHQAARPRCVGHLRAARLGLSSVNAMGSSCPASMVALRGATTQGFMPQFQHQVQ